MRRRTPLAAVLEGIAAGLAASVAQDIFFALTKKIAPSQSDVFSPPEREQKDENPTETVARRVVELVAQRAPLHNKAAAGRIVHFTYGATCGAVYGIVAGSSRRPNRLSSGICYGMGVWFVSDNVLMPMFRLYAWPTAYKLRSHAYAIAAHLVYGGVLHAVFHALERSRRPAIVALGALVLTQKLPRGLRAKARPLARGGIRFALEARDVAQALRG